MENEVTKTENADTGISPKSRLAALLLAIFAGGFGAHQFYLGRIARGIAHLLLYIIGLALYITGLVLLSVSSATDDISIPAIAMLVVGIVSLLIPGIWSFVSWILIAVGKAKDSNGLLLRNWTD